MVEVQHDAKPGLAGIGFNLDYAFSAGSTVTGVSKTELTGSASASNSKDVQLVSIVDGVDNDGTISNANWVIKFNDPQGKPVRTGT